jgi:hypothetical protein
MFIPSGWWHTVINLDETWAITQNFVDENNLEDVARFLQSKRSKKLWKLFYEGMMRYFPEEITKVVAKIGNVLSGKEMDEENECDCEAGDGGMMGGMMGGGVAEDKTDSHSKWEDFVGNEEEDAAWQLF